MISGIATSQFVYPETESNDNRRPQGHVRILNKDAYFSLFRNNSTLKSVITFKIIFCKSSLIVD